MVKTFAWIFAAVFLAVGVAGFVPGLTTTDGMLLGIFMVDPLHNIIHLATGVVALIVALMSAKASSLFFKVFGVVYAIVAVVGLVQGDTVLGLIHTNMADHILHVVIAVVALYVGFGMKSGGAAPSVPPNPMGGGMKV